MNSHPRPLHTILVVEDEPALLQAVEIKMTSFGFEVIPVRSVQEAVSILNGKQAIDAIWLDHYLMGKESGLDLVARLKGDSSPWKHIPIFVVSNTASDEKVNSYLLFGITKYYVKTNYRLDEIINEINDYLLTQKDAA